MNLLPAESLLTLTDALSFSAERHRDQRRKDRYATPYLNHPIALLDVLVREGQVTDIEVLVAALLHDTIEDTATTEQELAEQFGVRVAALVMELTDDKSLPKAERKRLQVEHAGDASHKARLVKLADKVVNLRDLAANPPSDWPLERRQQYFDWAAAVLVGLRGTHATLERAYEQALELRPRA